MNLVSMQQHDLVQLNQPLRRCVYRIESHIAIEFEFSMYSVGTCNMQSLHQSNHEPPLVNPQSSQSVSQSVRSIHSICHEHTHTHTKLHQCINAYVLTTRGDGSGLILGSNQLVHTILCLVMQSALALISFVFLAFVRFTSRACATLWASTMYAQWLQLQYCYWTMDSILWQTRQFRLTFPNSIFEQMDSLG